MCLRSYPGLDVGFIVDAVKTYEDKDKQDQGDLCRSPGFYFELDFIFKKF